MTTETPILRPTYDDRPNRPRLTARRVVLPGELPGDIEFPAPLLERLAALERLSGDYAAARRQLNEAETGRSTAERSDRQAYAAALRLDSDAKPSGTALAGVGGRIAELTERIGALRIARDEAESDLVTYLEQDGPDVTASIQPALEEARKARAKAELLAAKANGRLDEVLAIGAWVGDPYHRPVAPRHAD
jgi:hypothetical protein